ncbi:mitochondrial ribosomal protein L37-domain-containing protein [Chiua virens]|nr:mitochondrial ribosomal protein L37-domain-containing protein [Chiua virens]
MPGIHYETNPNKSPYPGPDIVSSCPAGTIMTGFNYLKNELPILAKPDEEYPAWLWDLTKPKVLADDGPGGKAEKRRLRLSHRQALKDSNCSKSSDGRRVSFSFSSSLVSSRRFDR